MKLIKQLTLSFIIVLLSKATFATTSWDELNRMAPKATIINVKSSDGLVQAKLIRYSANLIRINELVSLQSKNRPTVVIDSSDQNIQQLCEKSVRLRKRFNAKLLLNLNSFYENSQPIKVFSESSEEFDLFKLSNQLNIGTPQIVVANSALKWSLYDAMPGSGAGSIQEVYEKFLNEKISDAVQDVVEIDLSDKNALACDLIEGYLSFTLRRVIQHEAGFPDIVDWIGKEKFLSVFQSFWDLNFILNDQKLTKDEQQQVDFVRLGLSAANKIEVDKLFKNNERWKNLHLALQKPNELSDSVKKQAKYEEIIQNHKMTFEYRTPQNMFMRKSFITTGTPVKLIFNKKGL